jgi:RNA polymerase sigma-B factor
VADDPVRERFRAWRETGDRTIRNELIEEHRWIALTCARRFTKRGEPLDDLFQVAQLGVLKAVERFNPEYGVPFVSFAMPTVLGELRRHFRDATWAVRVPRRAKELHLELAKAIDDLSHSLERSPTVEELAEHMRCEVDDVLDAMEAGAAYRTAPLTWQGDGDQREGGEDSARMATVDAGLIGTDDRLHVQQLLETLPERERKIVELRFFDELTQAEIAAIMGISQVHVSRLLRASVRRLRAHTDLPDPVPS